MPRHAKSQVQEVVPVAPVTPLLLSTNEAATYLGVTRWTIRKLRVTRELQYVPIAGRVLFDPVDLRELVAARKTFYTQKPGRRPPRKSRRLAVKPAAHSEHGPESPGDTAAVPDASAH